MIAATTPVQRPGSARLLVVAADGDLVHAKRSEVVHYLRTGDLLIANDAATIPASLYGAHEPSGEEIEVRLAGRGSLSFDDVDEVTAVVFGAGDHRTPTEKRPSPPPLRPGDRLTLGGLRATVVRSLDHPRLVVLAFAGSPEEIWSAIAEHGNPIQYAHIDQDLALWDVWTRVASVPAAFEPPSAGFLLDWRLLSELREHGVEFATLTHAAGLSSTGDPALDRRLPLDEAYRIPVATTQAIGRARAEGGRVIAVGTTVARALEHSAASSGEPRPGAGVANQRIGPATELRVVDAIVSGAHEPTESHYELLRAFTDDEVLERMTVALEEGSYRTHEFGDSVLVERRRSPAGSRCIDRGTALLSADCIHVL